MMNKIKLVSTAFLGLLLNFCSSAQTNADTGRISVIQDQRIGELVKKHVEINSKTAVKGYRVKIHFGVDRDKAKEIMANFSSQYATTPAYIKYDQPNFNVSVGNFRTKLEAFRFLKELQPNFPSAFVVQDEIETSTVETSQKEQ